MLKGIFLQFNAHSLLLGSQERMFLQFGVHHQGQQRLSFLLVQ